MVNKSESLPGNIKYKIPTSRLSVRALKAKADARRTIIQIIADWINLKIGSIGFPVFNFPKQGFPFIRFEGRNGLAD
ncbi:hypothetical protein A3J20_06640 [Candidatus Gottesmanbacteria bacterium RIFCSPLOWO2_02_FULL_42_29]|uniref:Uncharacterized protein n=1 Tax=Candidatus Gottesmanbacteria bacterium RIFCSPLOWO2_01_FULL_42_22 TaxID=1798391 RepID=A0A1F6BKF6_9BACT|nr:MAG: hypothetical protein A2781_01635 [Candidatus Gottesmanbacteria bacterium RIFCSPHIGHO2_01_FULL_42_27]OGG19530.1 MAG: hypothetical protein A3E72_02570 [Candidatus Gottesmanbacteria bacterium RIFCSPHIGHO2_12_FULL_43_26]OGG35881.1 MAG: hypothetical protein A3G68_02385 [Candidatus Gottesmanbacteria bacterium RIFCSPLOWO2_12_FULL_42_10]OGG36623.1 MAG: hypothetical protein A3J20_06640 [Candidatus Gottesmanbacteria bacterium RIFCSPLOWO2_02_FULL_42_29]OGG37390.1 MAG: hypothetical protein A2968_04